MSFFIKEGYKANPVKTWEDSPGEFWTPSRVERAKRDNRPQWHVYQLASEFGANSVADVGCGYPTKASQFFGACDVWDQPTLREVVEENFPDLIFHSVDLEAPEPTSERFDLVVCSDVVEHLRDPTPCLDWLRELLEEDGVLVISTPERDLVRGADNLQCPNVYHVREWNKSEFAMLLESRGLVVCEHVLLPAWKEGDNFSCQAAVCRRRA